MTATRELLETRLAAIKDMKNQVVAMAGPDDNDDLTPIVEGLRNGEPAVLVICHDVDRDQGLNASRIMVSGWELDEVWMTVDAHVSGQPNDPRTGKPWAPHAMQNFCDNENGCDLGVITDTLFMFRCHKDGWVDAASAPYHVHKTDREVAWITGEELFFVHDDENDTAVLKGLIPDEIRSHFTLPTAREILEAKAPADIRNDPAFALNVARFARQGAQQALATCGTVMTGVRVAGDDDGK